jgi:hypothetical protein
MELYIPLEIEHCTKLLPSFDVYNAHYFVLGDDFVEWYV